MLFQAEGVGSAGMERPLATWVNNYRPLQQLRARDGPAESGQITSMAPLTWHEAELSREVNTWVACARGAEKPWWQE